MITNRSTPTASRCVNSSLVLNMSRPFKITLGQENGSSKEISGEFTDEEAAILEQYLQHCGDLMQFKPLREGMPCNFSLDFSDQDGLKASANLPSKDDLSILLHRLRPFILQNEPSSFHRVSSIIGKRVPDDHIRNLLTEQRECYDGRQTQKMMRVVSNEMIVNSENVLQNWLNSYEYHRDPDKRATIDRLFASMPGDLLTGILVSMLVDKTRAVGNVSLLVAFLLGKQKEIRFKLHKL